MHGTEEPREGRGCVAILPNFVPIFLSNYFHNLSRTTKKNTILPRGLDSAGPTTPTTPPPPPGASGQQFVAKGAALRSSWAPNPPKGKFCPLSTTALSLNAILTLTPTPILSLVLTLHLPLLLPLALSLVLALTRIECWE